MARKLPRMMIIGMPVILVVAVAAWVLFPTLAETEPDLALDTAVTAPADGVHDDGSDGQSTVMRPEMAFAALPDAAELNRLSLSRQSFRRGGLGSRALVSFTLRNANDYAVKDMEILCVFRSRDGSLTTERRRTIADTVRMKSRKAFPPTPMGFVNVRADKARCSVVTASRA